MVESNAIYVEEYDEFGSLEETEAKGMRIRKYTSGDSEEEINNSGHKEVDPFIPVKAEVFEIGEGGFKKVEVFDPIERKKKKSTVKAPVKAPVKSTIKKQELKVGIDIEEEKVRLLEEQEMLEEKIEIKPLVVQAPPIRRRPLRKVIFEGSFGKISAGYLDVYLEGMYVILVEEQDSEFSYTPPESDIPFTVIIEDDSYEVLSPGISFGLPNQKLKLTILLMVGESYE